MIQIPESGRKDESKWLLVKHGKTSLEEIKNALKSDEDVWLKQEGAILHVCCKTIEDAESGVFYYTAYDDIEDLDDYNAGDIVGIYELKKECKFSIKQELK